MSIVTKFKKKQVISAKKNCCGNKLPIFCSFDLVDFTRQYLVLLGSSFYNLTMESYFNKDFPEFLTRTSKFLELLDDLESVLRTNQHFMLGPWLEASKALGSTDDEIALLEYNARIQVLSCFSHQYFNFLGYVFNITVLKVTYF